jgi:hypothetical protein
VEEVLKNNEIEKYSRSENTKGLEELEEMGHIS